MVNFGPLAAEIVSLVWGTAGNFNGFRVLAALLHGIVVVGVSQTLRRWTEDATYIRQSGHHVRHWHTFLVLQLFLLISCTTFTMQWHTSMVYAMALCLSITSWCSLQNCCIHHQAINTYNSGAKDIVKNPTGSPQHTHTQLFYGPFSGTTQVSRCQKKSSSGLHCAREDNWTSWCKRR